jgi:hypothetical protein
VCLRPVGVVVGGRTLPYSCRAAAALGTCHPIAGVVGSGEGEETQCHQRAGRPTLSPANRLFSRRVL